MISIAVPPSSKNNGHPFDHVAARQLSCAEIAATRFPVRPRIIAEVGHVTKAQSRLARKRNGRTNTPARRTSTVPFIHANWTILFSSLPNELVVIITITSWA